LDLADNVERFQKNINILTIPGTLREVKKVNEAQKAYFLGKIKSRLWIIKGKTIGVLGVSFKPDTDDIRNAPALDIVRLLLKEGAHVRVYDPSAMPRAKEALKGSGSFLLLLSFC
jgi:UDPglucose 6-dehydrogenase